MSRNVSVICGHSTPSTLVMPGVQLIFLLSPVAIAVARPRLKLEAFDSFYATMREARQSFHQALDMLQAHGSEPPTQKRVMQYCMDFMMAQAHRIVLWRCSEEQLERARTAPLSSGGIQQDFFDTYRSKLQTLRMQSAEEAFQAARRIMRSISVSHG